MIQLLEAKTREDFAEDHTLYNFSGFEEIESYRYNPEAAAFLELELI